MTITRVRFTAEAHKSHNPSEVHWYVLDRSTGDHHGNFLYVENAQAAATRMTQAQEACDR